MPDELVIVYGDKPPANSIEKTSILTILIGSKKEKIVAFNDWSIDFLQEKEFEEAIKRDNKLRIELGLETKQDE
jgi:hypothetical protein